MITILNGKLTIPESERFIGFAGDNLRRTIKFLVSSKTEADRIYRMYLTFDDGTVNFFTLPFEVTDLGVVLTWEVLREHIFKSGCVKMQIKAFSDKGVVWHTNTDTFIVGASAEFSEQLSKQNTEFLQLEERLNNLSKEISEICVLTPFVGENGNWYIYDAEICEYVDSGKPSVGLAEGVTISDGDIDRTSLFSSDMAEKFLSLPVYKRSLLDRFPDDYYNSLTEQGIYKLDSVSGMHQVVVVLSPDSTAYLMQLKFEYNHIWYRGIWCTEEGKYPQEDWEEWTELTMKSESASAWKEKTAVFYGDSLTEVNYHYTKGYHEWVKELLGLKSYLNYGKSGYDFEDVYNEICSTYTTSDIVFVMCGVGEMTHSVPTGAISDTTTDTTYGRLNLICEKIKEKYPTSVVVFITPAYQTKYPHNLGVTSYEVSKAIKEVCEKFAIPVYDNFTLSGICKNNLSAFTTDNCHWNDAAHEMVGKNLANYVADTFRYVHGYTAKNEWIGKKVTVEKNCSADKDANLTCLIGVDEDIKKGAVLKLNLTGTNCKNVLSLTSAYGGLIYGDDSGAVNNASFNGQLTTKQTSQITLDDAGVMKFICGEVTITKDITTPYIKVMFVLFGDEPYSFNIEDISITVNGKEKPILAIGAFFKPEKEIITIE